jgi:hypothetical protein
MTRIALSVTTAIASILGAALPAFAQAPAPAPMYAPAPPPAPMYAPPPAPMAAPAPEAAVMPVAPVVAPRAADDMTGSVGFGTGVTGGTVSLATIDNTVFMKYWMSDALAIIPRLSFHTTKIKDTDAAWSFSPAILANFVLLKGASTRLSAGLGLGLDLAKNRAPAVAGSTDTYVGLYIPVMMDVEHFFARWFSMGVGTGFNFIDFAKQGDGWQLDLDISNVNYLGYLTFYTD